MRSGVLHLLILLAACLVDAESQNMAPTPELAQLQKVPDAIQPALLGFSLADVRLLDSPFKVAMEMNGKYLLELDPDRLLHRFHEFAGLPVKGDLYGGWEEGTLSGHSLGHYLSGCAQMYAATGQEDYKQRTDYVVDELARCQAARGTGYVGAIPKEDSTWSVIASGEIVSRGFDLNGLWSPWYNLHKVFAGLLDVYQYTGNRKALEIAIKFADWINDKFAGLTEEQWQEMLKCEYGGMNDALVNLYALTKNEKYLALSRKFHDHTVLDPLAKGEDNLAGKHGNTQIPKVIGCARRYELTGNPEDSSIARFFWDRVVYHHSYVTGSHGISEYFGAADQLNDKLSDATGESCNVYNMLKLTQHLFTWTGDPSYADFYERALYNHILASIEGPGQYCYFIPLRQGTKRHYSNKFHSFWCCVGTAMENHGKYAEHIYFTGQDGSLVVNLYIPSKLNWHGKEMELSQTGDPATGAVTMRIGSDAPHEFTLKLRHPDWATQGMRIWVNGSPILSHYKTTDYASIKRIWHDGDVIRIEMPADLREEAMPDNPDRIALLYGPYVLAGQLPEKVEDPLYEVPVIVTDNRQPDAWVTQENNHGLRFHSEYAGRPYDLSFIPFYQADTIRYTTYLDYFTDAGWEQRKQDFLENQKRQAEIDRRTVDLMRLGEMQPERDHHLSSVEASYVYDESGRKGRDARNGGYFEFDMMVDPQKEQTLMATYWGSDRGKRAFDILVNGQKIGTQQLNENFPGVFFDVEYPIPRSLTRGKHKVRVRFQGHPENTAGVVYGVRMLTQ
ncbi:MAG: glycoside hydrolase family 127 protein [Saprospiraceae bacterium]